MHAHTPGPWVFDPAAETITGAAGNTIIYETNTNEADARLIATTPELLEAVAMLAAALNDAIPAIITAGVEGGYRFRAEKHALGHAFLLCHAHTLIAKATGNT